MTLAAAPYAGDVDVFGKLILDPVPITTDASQPAGDPCLAVIGEHIKAVMMARLNDAWSSLDGNSLGRGGDVVKSISYNNPKDNTFIAKDFPSLYVFQPRDKRDKLLRYCDCQFWNVRYVTVLWVPPEEFQTPRANRVPFFNAISKAVRAALALDRFPGYIAVGDTDPFAPVHGSSLMITAGLSKELADDDDVEFQVIDIEKEMPTPGKKGTWEGARFNLRIYEDLDVSQTMRGNPGTPKLDLTITENARTVELYTDGLP
jgi:hypothetical protein